MKKIILILFLLLITKEIKSLELDGANQYVDFGIIDTKAVSWGGWFRIHAYGSYNGMFGCGTFDGALSGDRYFMLAIPDFSGQDIAVGLASTGLAKNVYLQSWLNFTDQKWFHIFATYQSNDSLKIYLSGTNVFQSEVLYVSLQPTTLSVKYGLSKEDGSYGYFNGDAYDLRIYNRVLTAKEILTIYKSKGSDNIAKGLLLRALLNDRSNGITSDNSVHEVKDISGNRYHGTCYNSPVFWGSLLKLHGGE